MSVSDAACVEYARRVVTDFDKKVTADSAKKVKDPVPKTRLGSTLFQTHPAESRAAGSEPAPRTVGHHAPLDVDAASDQGRRFWGDFREALPDVGRWAPGSN